MGVRFLDFRDGFFVLTDLKLSFITRQTLPIVPLLTRIRWIFFIILNSNESSPKLLTRFISATPEVSTYSSQNFSADMFTGQ